MRAPVNGLGRVRHRGRRLPGAAFPPLFEAISRLEYASVNLIVAVLIWLMVYPMKVNVGFASLKDVGRRPNGLCITLTINWLIKPFTMAALGLLFFDVIFAEFVEETI